LWWCGICSNKLFERLVRAIVSKKGNFNFKVKDLVKEADQTANEKKEANLRGKRRYNGGMKKLKDEIKLDNVSNPNNKITEIDPKDILLNKNNFNNLMIK